MGQLPRSSPRPHPSPVCPDDLGRRRRGEVGDQRRMVRPRCRPDSIPPLRSSSRSRRCRSDIGGDRAERAQLTARLAVDPNRPRPSLPCPRVRQSPIRKSRAAPSRRWVILVELVTPRTARIPARLRRTARDAAGMRVSPASTASAKSPSRARHLHSFRGALAALRGGEAKCRFQRRLLTRPGQASR